MSQCFSRKLRRYSLLKIIFAMELLFDQVFLQILNGTECADLSNTTRAHVFEPDTNVLQGDYMLPAELKLPFYSKSSHKNGATSKPVVSESLLHDDEMVEPIDKISNETYHEKRNDRHSEQVEIFHNVNDSSLCFTNSNASNATCLFGNEYNSGSDDINSIISRTPLYIGGLFDLTGAREESLGQSEVIAAKMAVKHINEQNVLDGYELVLLHNDTGCEPGVGINALYDLIYRPEQMLMVIGSACSEVTITLAEIVPYWNLILVSFASTSPALSEREKYGTFFRLASSDSSQNIPRAMFISHFGWDTVGTIYEAEEDYSLAMDEMGATFEQNNITIKISLSFRRYEDITDSLTSLKKQDARIIIGGFSEKAARHVLCEAYHLRMFGPRYVWIMLEDYVEGWWEKDNGTSCSREQLAAVADGYFTIGTLNSLSEDEITSTNITLRQFLRDYDVHEGPKPLSPYATSTYDTIWTIALTIKRAISGWTAGNQSAHDFLQRFGYETGSNVSKTFLNIMQDLSFVGISGPISFEGPDRKGISVISQNQDGRMMRIALYEPGRDKLDFSCERQCRPIVWNGGRTPRDKIILVTRQKKITPLAYLCVSSFSIAGLLLAAFFLSYNIYHRKLRYIKLSSPKLNNMAVVGCMLVYTGIIVLGYDTSELDRGYYPVVCTTRAFLFAAGFSLAFGAMFTKTYRVHQIFTRSNGSLIKSKLLRDKQLLFIVGALLMVDCVVFTVWISVDPMQKTVTNLTREASERDVDLVFISQLTKCQSDHLDKWTGALYAYKGLLLIFGVYMAWETRNVKIAALNDSRYIGMNVYNVVIMSVLVVTLSNIIGHQPTLAYVMESSFMLLSTTTTLCLLFVPKIYSIINFKGEPVIAASGITVNGGNCRRFAVDERKDLIYRAEVQNRVYKREIVELDQEILRLEHRLELPVQPYPKITPEVMFLLDESLVDPTPELQRKNQEDTEFGGSLCDHSDAEIDDVVDQNRVGNMFIDSPSQLMRLALSPNNRKSRISIRSATNLAVAKLCKQIRPRFSMGGQYDNSDYECLTLKQSPSSPECLLSRYSENHLAFPGSRSSQPLLRQVAFDERNQMCGRLTPNTQDSEKSETFESQLSETEQDICVPIPTVRFDLTDISYIQNDSTSSMTSLHFMPDDSEHGDVHSNTGMLLEVPEMFDECRERRRSLSTLQKGTTVIRRAETFLDNERRTRIRNLKRDLGKIQKELQYLEELEYHVSVV